MSNIEIHRLELRYRAPNAMRRQFDELAVRQLPAALDAVLGGLDDGRIIVLRKVESRVRLGRPRDSELVTSWAAQLAASIQLAIDQATPDRDANVVIFADAIGALASYVSDALRGRLEAWWWQEPGVLALVRGTLSGVPGSSPALGPPPSPNAPPAVVIEWALRLCGAALPRLIECLQERREAAAALTALSPAQAESLLAQLDLPPSPRDARNGDLPRIANELAATAPIGTPRDPRNVLFLTALALASQPSLRSAAGVRAAVEHMLEQRAQGWPPLPLASQQLPHAEPTPAESLTLLPEPPTSPPPERYVAGVATSFGGLLYLFDPVRRLQIAEAFWEDPLLADSPGFGPILYLIFCCLLPEAFADAAALWSAGLSTPTVPAVAMDEQRAAAILRADARIRDAAAALPCRLLVADEADLRAQAARVPLVVLPWLAEICLRSALRLIGHLRARLELDEDPPLPALIQRVCARPGRLVRTRTHLDLYLPIESADVAIRKAMLDLNPGWVPALSTIVNIHYE